MHTCIHTHIYTYLDSSRSPRLNLESHRHTDGMSVAHQSVSLTNECRSSMSVAHQYAPLLTS